MTELTAAELHEWVVAEMNRYKDERDAADDEVTRLTDALLQVDERALGAEYDCGLLRAEIKALEDEIELCPAEGYHTNPTGLSLPKEPHYSETPVSLITVEGQYSGYYLEDIEATMDAEELKRWKVWARGITGAFHEGRMLVYAHDWINFKAGRPNLD